MTKRKKLSAETNPEAIPEPKKIKIKTETVVKSINTIFGGPALAIPNIIQIINLLPAFMKGRIARVNRTFYALTKTFNSAGNSVAIDSSDSLYNQAKVPGKILVKLAKMGFEEDQAHLWLKGINSADEFKDFESFVDLALVTLDYHFKHHVLSSNWSYDKASKRQALHEKANHYLNKRLVYPGIMDTPGKPIYSGSQFAKLSNFIDEQKESGKDINFAAIFQNANPVVLAVACEVSGFKPYAAYAGLSEICKNNSLLISRILHQQGWLTLTPGEAVASLNAQLKARIKHPMTKEQLKAVRELFVASSINVPTVKLLQHINNVDYKDFYDLIKVMKKIYKSDSLKVREILLCHLIDVPQLLLFYRMPVTFVNKSNKKSARNTKNLFDILIKSQVLAKFLLDEANRLKISLLDFASIYPDVVGFLYQHNKDDLQYIGPAELYPLLANLNDPKHLYYRYFDLDKKLRGEVGLGAKHELIVFLKQLHEKYPETFDVVEKCASYAPDYTRVYLDNPELCDLKKLDEANQSIMQSLMPNVVKLNWSFSNYFKKLMPEQRAIFINVLFWGLARVNVGQSTHSFELFSTDRVVSGEIYRIMGILLEAVLCNKVVEFIMWAEQTRLFESVRQFMPQVQVPMLSVQSQPSSQQSSVTQTYGNVLNGLPAVAPSQLPYAPNNQDQYIQFYSSASSASSVVNNNNNILASSQFNAFQPPAYQK